MDRDRVLRRWGIGSAILLLVMTGLSFWLWDRPRFAMEEDLPANVARLVLKAGMILALVPLTLALKLLSFRELRFKALVAGLAVSGVLAYVFLAPQHHESNWQCGYPLF